MKEFKKYSRKGYAELRPVTQEEVDQYIKELGEPRIPRMITDEGVSISQEDQRNGSPKIGDMIARNPKNHSDKWLVNEKYFKDNFKPKCIHKLQRQTSFISEDQKTTGAIHVCTRCGEEFIIEDNIG